MFFLLLIFLTSFCLASETDSVSLLSVFGILVDPNTLVNLEESEAFSGDYVKNPGYLKNYPNSDFAAIVVNTPLDSTYTSIDTKILYVIKNKGTTVREGTRFQSNGWKKTYIDGFLFHPVYMIADYKENKFDIDDFYSMDETVLTSTDAFFLDRFGMLIPEEFDFVLDMGATCIKEKKDYFLFRNMPLLHAFYTPYLNPSRTKWPSVELLKEKVKKHFMSIGKNEQDIQLFYKKLSQNRTSVGVSPVNTDFVSLGRIGGMKDVEKDGASFCEIIIYPIVIFSDSLSKHQNTYVEDNYDVNIIEKGRPRVIKARKRGSCFAATKMYQLNYLFGSYQEKSLFLDSLLSPWDFLYDNGKLIDLRMGLAYDDFLSYFIPSELTLDDAYFSRLFMDCCYTSQQKEQIESSKEKRAKYCREKKGLTK